MLNIFTNILGKEVKFSKRQRILFNDYYRAPSFYREEFLKELRSFRPKTCNVDLFYNFNENRKEFSSPGVYIYHTSDKEFYFNLKNNDI